jgi:hypothetical protein
MIRRTLIVPLVALILAAPCSLSATAASADSAGLGPVLVGHHDSVISHGRSFARRNLKANIGARSKSLNGEIETGRGGPEGRARWLSGSLAGGAGSADEGDGHGARL